MSGIVGIPTVFFPRDFIIAPPAGGSKLTVSSKHSFLFAYQENIKRVPHDVPPQMWHRLLYNSQPE